MHIRTYLTVAALAAGAALGTTAGSANAAITDACGAVPSDYLHPLGLSRTYTGTLKGGSVSYKADVTFNAIGNPAAQLGYVAETADGGVAEARRGIAALSSDSNGIGQIDFDFPHLQTVSIVPVCTAGSPKVKSIQIKAQDMEDKSPFKGSLA
ncbi:hypothetical protein GTW69_40170 [Streptomyces sp. SID7760]|nr:hypothetical protein [Streptomyces sp. SID7760]